MRFWGCIGFWFVPLYSAKVIFGDVLKLYKFIPPPLFQAGWSIPVDIVIGPPSQGIAYMTDSAVTVRAN